MLDASDNKNNSILSVHVMHFAQEALPDFLGHQVFQWVQSALGDPVLKCKEVLTNVETICQLQLSTKSFGVTIHKIQI